MSKNDEQNEEIRCSFCGKSRDEVNKLIAGQGVYICDECVKICDEILAESAVMTHADFLQENILKPADIKSVLDEYVIGQDEAKKRSLLRCTITTSASITLTMRRRTTMWSCRRQTSVSLGQQGAVRRCWRRRWRVC